jgi:prepilin-type processing-associated H-X9-DG protein
LATEFFNSWKAITDAATGVVVKSHRPIEAFYSEQSGSVADALYATPANIDDAYIYGDPGDPTNKTTRGVKKLADLTGKTGLIDGSAGATINAVGRHHPGQGETADYGGCANFLYCDGHVERKTIMQTMVNFEWGTKFYSMTGSNDIDLTR